MYNAVRQRRASRNGDVNGALSFFESRAISDEKMFWRFRLSPERNLCDIFWSDGPSQLDYHLFGDVLAFDATYGRNKYNLPVIVFSGVNHHNHTCIFGAAMVSCESQSSYVWVLQQFLECMGGKFPGAVITDGDRSMRLAIQEVFPDARHRLCAWHILKNATSHICKPIFTNLLRNCMLADVDVDEFELQWAAMVDECGVREVDWVNDLYAKKDLWATAYIRGSFFAGLRTTSRCESLHAKLGRFVDRRYGVHEFVINFQRCVDFIRDNEEELEFRSLYGTPVLQTEFPELEKSAAMEYTRDIFFRLRETLKSSVRIKILDRSEMDNKVIYQTQRYMRAGKRWTVEHVKECDRFCCSCKRMESFGLPCVHVIAVLVQLDRSCIPKSLIMARWSKNVKAERVSADGRAGEVLGETDSVFKSRVGAFLQLCKRYAMLACVKETEYKKCSSRVVEEIKILEQTVKAGEVGGGINSNCGDKVREPVPVRTKGTGTANEPVGSQGIKRRKCSACGELGHRRTRCTKASGAVDNGTQVSAGVTDLQSQGPSRTRLNHVSGGTSVEESLT
ncbi:hypothetical protein PIB30_119051 [Stylosanthes scabra]|uniref:SWIM-type domain-containing protein n=1 Tax=Stylosanthes scabra TaxID=79078 RepID=A0ABU6XM72_9FABA|nr:hypothetical protein [Stylosanthes scabra]